MHSNDVEAIILESKSLVECSETKYLPPGYHHSAPLLLECEVFRLSSNYFSVGRWWSEKRSKTKKNLEREKISFRWWSGHWSRSPVWNGKNIIRYTWFHLTFLASLRCCFSAVVLRFFCELLRLYYPVTSDYTFASERFRLYSEMDFRLSSPSPFSAIKHWICNQHFGRSRRSLAIKLPSIRCFILGRSVLAHSRASSVEINSEMRLSRAEEKLYYIWPCIIN